jgi:uncharacterized membrane protein
MDWNARNVCGVALGLIGIATVAGSGGIVSVIGLVAVLVAAVIINNETMIG